MSLPTFQPQNPALSGYRYGWSSCTAFCAAMVASASKGIPKLCTGGEVREQTGDHSGGLNLAQVATALEHWNVTLDVRYRLPWDQFAARINAGEPAILQGWYQPISVTRFDAGNGFTGNHAFAVYPDWVVADPLADGRFEDVYRYNGEKYPPTLLRSFAGKLNLGGSSYRPLGDGLVYAAFAPKVPTSWQCTIRPGGTEFIHYTVATTQYGLQIRGRQKVVTRLGFQLACTAPIQVWERPVGDGKPVTKRSLVRITAGSYSGWWVDAKWASEVKG